MAVLDGWLVRGAVFGRNRRDTAAARRHPLLPRSITQCEGSVFIRIHDDRDTHHWTGLWLEYRRLSQNLGKRHFLRLLDEARDGNFAQVTEEIAELISCTVPEDPRLHLLEGACGLALGDERHLSRALDALKWLDPSSLQAFLDVLAGRSTPRKSGCARPSKSWR